MQAIKTGTGDVFFGKKNFRHPLQAKTKWLLTFNQKNSYFFTKISKIRTQNSEIVDFMCVTREILAKPGTSYLTRAT